MTRIHIRFLIVALYQVSQAFFSGHICRFKTHWCIKCIPYDAAVLKPAFITIAVCHTVFSQQHLTQTSKTLSKKEKELAAVQKKAAVTKDALIHAQDVESLGKRTLLGNYSLTEDELSSLKKQAAHGYIVDVENRQLKQQLAAAKRDCAEWQTRYRDLRNDVQPYLDALLHAPERVRNFFENILARKSERTADTPSKASRQKNAEL